MSRRKPASQEEAKTKVVSINPATMDVIGEIPLSKPDDVKKAIQTAQDAFSGWANLGVAARARYMLRARDYILDHIDEVSRTITMDTGKPLEESLNAEVMVVVDLLTQYSKRAVNLLKDDPIALTNPIIRMTKTSKLVYRPLGVVSVISPWNYPFSLAMSGLIFALLAGNTVVFKPSTEVAVVGKKIEEIFLKGAVLPAGVFNMVVAAGSSVGTALFEPPVKKIIFTGSTAVGKWIQGVAARNFIPTVMELGGKDPMLVLDDADLEMASSGAVWGAFTNCGQVCSSVERVYVARSIYKRFVEMVEAKTNKLRIGSGLDFGVDMGPMISLDQLGVVENQVLDAIEKGARIVTGGKRPSHLNGYFHEPTVLTDVNHSMKAMSDETFGPLMPIMAFDAEEEAIALANDSVYGLTASVWTRDRKRAEKVARQIQSGTVAVNDHAYTYGLTETPWQGMKESGTGVSHSDRGLMEFVYPQHIHLDRSPAMIKRRLWWYPYSQEAYEIQKMAMEAFARSKKLPKFLANAFLNGRYRKTLF